MLLPAAAPCALVHSLQRVQPPLAAAALSCCRDPFTLHQNRCPSC